MLGKKKANNEDEKMKVGKTKALDGCCYVRLCKIILGFDTW